MNRPDAAENGGMVSGGALKRALPNPGRRLAICRSVSFRRILPVPVGAGERPFTEPTTAVRCRQRDPRAADRVC